MLTESSLFIIKKILHYTGFTVKHREYLNTVHCPSCVNKVLYQLLCTSYSSMSNDMIQFDLEMGPECTEIPTDMMKFIHLNLYDVHSSFEIAFSLNAFKGHAKLNTFVISIC
jgi:hypothetical protein